MSKWQARVQVEAKVSHSSSALWRSLLAAEDRPWLAGRMKDLFDLTGKVALVTGGSRGLGRQMVLAFANAGADVVIASRKADACDAVAAEVEAATDRQAMSYPCHVGQWDAVGELADAVQERFGKIDILVNNAGMSPLYPSLGEISEALWDKVIDVNLKGPFRLSAIVGERMVGEEQRQIGGHVGERSPLIGRRAAGRRPVACAR